jgi:hypothetical protein
MIGQFQGCLSVFASAILTQYRSIGLIAGCLHRLIAYLLFKRPVFFNIAMYCNMNTMFEKPIIYRFFTHLIHQSNRWIHSIVIRANIQTGLGPSSGTALFWAIRRHVTAVNGRNSSFLTDYIFLLEAQGPGAQLTLSTELGANREMLVGATWFWNT